MLYSILTSAFDLLKVNFHPKTLQTLDAEHLTWKQQNLNLEKKTFIDKYPVSDRF